jgi:hypothetical protein
MCRQSPNLRARHVRGTAGFGPQSRLHSEVPKNIEHKLRHAGSWQAPVKKRNYENSVGILTANCRVVRPRRVTRQRPHEREQLRAMMHL